MSSSPAHRPCCPSSVGRLASALLDLVLAPRCPACRQVTATEPPPGAGGLCARCWETVIPVEAPCNRCGAPEAAPQCARCRTATPAFDWARGAAAYGGELVTAIHRLKYRGASGLARPLGQLVAPLLAAAPAACVVPVPLHPRRLRRRGYNQAALLAAAAAASCPHRPPVLYGALRRRRPTPPLAGLDPAARRRVVTGVFSARPRLVAGRQVVLVDDVMTTGATADSCARALREAGATAVGVLTLARAMT